jgi:hypothetical protein
MVSTSNPRNSSRADTVSSPPDCCCCPPLLPDHPLQCKEPLGARLGTERAAASERPSSRAPVVMFLSLYLASSLTASCPTTSTLQSCNTRRKRPMRTNHSPSRSLLSYFLFLPPLTVLSNNAYRHRDNAATTRHPYALSFLSF